MFHVICIYHIVCIIYNLYFVYFIYPHIHILSCCVLFAYFICFRIPILSYTYLVQLCHFRLHSCTMHIFYTFIFTYCTCIIAFIFLMLSITDSCHGRVSGINKICFLCSSYCRSQAIAAYRSRVEHGDVFSSYE